MSFIPLPKLKTPIHRQPIYNLNIQTPYIIVNTDEFKWSINPPIHNSEIKIKREDIGNYNEEIEFKCLDLARFEVVKGLFSQIKEDGYYYTYNYKRPL